MLRRFVAFFLLCSMAYGLRAQVLNQQAREQGYLDADSTVLFVFDTALYGVQPQRVVVTGAFRGWSDDMDDARWALRPHDSAPNLWVLAVPNPRYELLGPSTPFKYRIDEGVWLDPPSVAPNNAGGNLVFLYGLQPPRLKAELRDTRAIWAEVLGDGIVRPLEPDAYRLTDARGTEIPLAAVLANTATETLVVPAEDLDLRRVYYLEIPSLDLRTRCSFDGWFRTLYSDKPLGANVAADGTETTFRVFAPRADLVRLYLYRLADDETPTKTIEMTRDAQGVWEATEAGDLHGIYYDFTVHGPQDPGNQFYETHPTHASDPYARVVVDSFGKSRVWRATTPPGPVRGGIPALEDVIAYEVHVQDFTDRLPVADDLKGTIPAMGMPGLRNSRGEPIGFDHIVDLGVNVVHLMPMQEYLHYPDDAWQAAFGDHPYFIEQGISEENYQWGYRTTHSFAIETRFRQKGTEHGAQRDQFRDLVQAFHDAGIAVIVDFVFNHTGENMDGRDYQMTFNAFDKQYYYRTDDDGEHIGDYGNETKSENRPMVYRWLLDQCLHFIEEFGVDGFRIDLAGQTDEQTLRAIRRAVGDSIIVYGEPWIASRDPDYEANPDWDWYKIDSPITFFQDDARNAFKGPTSNPTNKLTDRGYAGGHAALRATVMQGLLNSFPEEIDPNRGINYLDIHDNWALADRFATTDWDGRQGVDEGPFKVAAGLLFTSLGPIVLHAGTELMRSKGHAPLQAQVFDFQDGKLYFHGKRDTYNLRRANHFVWEDKGQTKADGPNDYAGMYDYWKGLIAFRLSEPGAVFRRGTAPPPGYYQWHLPADNHLLGYTVADRVLVLINTRPTEATFDDITLPSGTWQLIANDDAVDHVNGVSGPDARLTGSQAHTLTVPPTSIKIWVRE